MSFYQSKSQEANLDSSPPTASPQVILAVRRWTKAPDMVHLLSILDSTSSYIPSPLLPMQEWMHENLANTPCPGGSNFYTSSSLHFHPTRHRKGLYPWVPWEAGSSFSLWPARKSAKPSLDHFLDVTQVRRGLVFLPNCVLCLCLTVQVYLAIRKNYTVWIRKVTIPTKTGPGPLFRDTNTKKSATGALPVLKDFIHPGNILPEKTLENVLVNPSFHRK